MKPKYLTTLLLTLAVPYSSLTDAAANQAPQLQTDITFIVAGKTANFRQFDDGKVAALNYHFFAEIFVQTNGVINQAGLLTPGRPADAIAFTDSGYALEMHGGRYATESELENHYPDGHYIFRYDTPSTGAVEQIIALTNSSSNSSRIPDAPQIILSQAGERVLPHMIQADMALQVSWSEFKQGDQDPLGIVNDLVFVIMGDCHGKRRSHSGRPFENMPYLDYAATQFIIPAEHLMPENAYQLSVEHAIVDTTIMDGVPGFATFATTTFLDIMTLGGANEATACTEILQNFDAGQTDLR
ncbi:MAG: hypothetical protein VX709_10870 [Pseudomonadota bacterium]|nr:hypothetical protein [Pseudomonadota bacterium]